MKIKILALVFTVVLAAFTVYAVLDTFVISRVYQSETTDTDMFAQREAAVAANNATLEETDADDQLSQENDTLNNSNNPSTSSETEEQESLNDGDDQTFSDANDDDSDRNDRSSSEDEGNSSERRDWTVSSDNDNFDEWESRGNSSDNANDQDNWWSSSDNDDNGNSNGWGNNRRSSSDNDYGGSGNWEWGDNATSDGPTEIDVTEEDAMVYKDENIQITITLYEVNDSTVYAADVQLSSAEYLKSAFAKNSYGKNVTDETSDIASEHNAILAINGDYYGARESGYVIRNGVVYRDKADDADVLCIYADGSMTIVDPEDYSAQDLIEQGVWQAYSFGPALVIDGEIEATSGNETKSRWRWGWGSTESNNPRTALGMYEPLHYLFVVSDGRTNKSEGLTLDELAEFMQNMGVTTAYNLDGGGSSTMVFQDEVINRPTTTGAVINERNISDIIYIGLE